MMQTETGGPLWPKRSLPIQQRFFRRLSRVCDTAGLIKCDIVGVFRSAGVIFQILVMCTDQHSTVETSGFVHVTADGRYPT